MSARPPCLWLLLALRKSDIGGELGEPAAQRRFLLGRWFVHRHEVSITAEAHGLPLAADCGELRAELLVLLRQTIAVRLELLLEQHLTFREQLSLGKPDTALIAERCEEGGAVLAGARRYRWGGRRRGLTRR